MLTTQVKILQLAVWNARTHTYTYNNTTGADVTIAAGTLMGRIFSSGYVVAQVSTATDGSQIPRGFVLGATTIPANSSGQITLVVSGDIVKTSMILGGSDTLATAISNGGIEYGTIEDCLVAVGLLPVDGTDNTYPDN